MTTSAYSMKNVVATIDRRPVLGLFDGDDVIVVEENADIGEMMIGADGSSIFSQAVNNGATITVRLQHTSPTHVFLTERLKRQKARGGEGTGFAFTVKDRISGEGGAADQCFISQAPGQQHGVNATVREWVLVTGDYRRNAQ